MQKAKPRFRVGQVVCVWRPTGPYEFLKVRAYVGALILFHDGSRQFPNLCRNLTAREISLPRKEKSK